MGSTFVIKYRHQPALIYLTEVEPQPNEGFLFFLIGLFSLFEIINMDNNLHGTILFIIFSILGLIISIFLTNLIKKRFSIIALKNRKTNTFVIGGILCLFIFGLPGLANYYNRKCFDTLVCCQNYNVIRKVKNDYDGYESYYIYVVIKNSNERLTLNKSLWDKLTENKEVNLCIFKGGLGFDFVKTINLPSEK